MNTDKPYARANAEDYLHDELTQLVLGCAFKVHNALGCGFLEKIYENSLALELRHEGLFVEQQKCMQVRYRGELVGEYFADLLVERRLVVELKAAKGFDDVHTAQCLNYLRASDLRVSLLLNFGTPRLGIRRISN